MKKMICLLLLLFVCYCIKAQKLQSATMPNPEVRTVLQSGHEILGYDVSPNQKYVLTTDGQSVAIWDIEKRRIIIHLPLPNKGARFNAVNPSWIHILPVNDLASLRNETLHTYNIFTGEKIGIKQKKDLLPQKRATDNYLLKLNEGVITITSRSSGTIVGTFSGNSVISTGRICLNSNDSLLLASGLMPQVWDLKEARLLVQIPYRDFLKQDPNLHFYNDKVIPLPKTYTRQIERNDYQYGYRNFYEGYFTRNKQIILGGFNPYITRWNLQGQLLEQIKTDGSPIFAFTDNGKYRAAATYQGLNMGGISANKLDACKEFNKELGYKLLYQISPVFRERYFFTGGDDMNLLQGELGNPGFKKKVKYLDAKPMCYSIDQDEKTVLIAGELGYLAHLSIDNPQQMFRYNTSVFKNSRADCCTFMDNNMLVAGCTDGILAFWKKDVAMPTHYFQAHGAAITDTKLSHNHRWLLSADADSNFKIWDAKSLQPIMSFHHLGDENDYIFLTPDNYYKGSKDIFDKIHFAKGMEVYSFEQFDLKYNRPDIILQRLGGSPKKIAILYKAWQKRIKKMGYTEAMLSGDIHTPEMQIVNKREIPLLTKTDQITLQLKATDSKYKLRRIFISLNGVPLLGVRGKEIPNKQLSKYTYTYKIKLATGNNRINVFCLNEKGVESYKTQLDVYCEKPVQKPDLYIAAIGVSHYQDSKYNLSYAAKDATDFAAMMKQKSNHRFANIHQMVLTDENFTPTSLLRLKEFFKQGKRDDAVILFYAGHGVLDREMDYFLSTHTMNFDSPQQNGVSYNKFEETLDGIEPIHKFCFIDACHSGEIDKEDYLAENILTVPAGKVVFRNAGTGMRKLKPNGVEQVKSLVQELFINIRWGVGATILSSAGGMEAALEGNTWKNGLFTWCLKKGIMENAADTNRDNRITANELINYVSNEVNALSEGKQTPNMRIENKLQDFILIEP